jgi:hypothetical protein
MTPPSLELDSSAVKIRLTRDQTSILWPGLNYIVCQFLNWKNTGTALTSYPFRIWPLPLGFDSGTFSQPMMDRMQKLWAKIQPIRTTGGKLSLDELELRAAIFSARTGVKLERYQIRKARKKKQRGPNRGLATAKRALKKHKAHKEAVVEFLETVLKRANRRLKAVIGPEEFKALSTEWQSHLLWMKYRLTYFKPDLPLPQSGWSIRKVHRSWVDTLVKMVTKAIVEMEYQPPEPAKLREVMYRYLTYSLRGRMGQYHHIFMVQNQDLSPARYKLLAFLQNYVVLKEAS